MNAAAAALVVLNGRQAFDPRASLFAHNEPGFWYDPSDLSSMYQDSAGTTPVTAVEQAVGRILDKSGRGNHAIQPGATNRPILRSRYNLLTYSEQFDNAAWTKTNLNTTGTPAYVNVAVAPDGTTTADKLIANTTSGLHFYRQNIATLAGSYTMSVYAKAAEYTGLWLSMDGGSNYGLFTLTGAGTATATIGTATITAVGNGWYLCTHTATRVAGTAVLFFAAANPPGTLSFAGNDSDGILLWGADFRAANDIASGIPSYQRIAAATDYDTVGFPVYLAFDGSDDSLYTGGNVDFSGTDKVTLWVGVTKLSDAARGIVVELTAGVPTNNGSFNVNAPYTAAADYGVASKGTNAADITTAASFASPHTSVLTMQGDIGGDNLIVRVNAVESTPNTNDQGTGNYASAVLNIGRRNNASLPFNGRLYQLIGRGAATSAALITQAERWVAGKQGRAL